MGAAAPFIAPVVASAAGSVFSGLANRNAPKTFNPLTAQQQSALDALLPGLVQGGVTAGQSQSGINQALSGAIPTLSQGLTPGGQDEIFQQAVVDPTLRNFSQSILPQIQQSAQNAGASSSSAFNRSLATAGTNLAADLASQRANFGLQQQQQALNNLIGLGQFNLQQEQSPLSFATQGLNQNLVGGRQNANVFDTLAGTAGQIFAGTLPGVGVGSTQNFQSAQQQPTLQDLINALNANNASTGGATK